MPWNLPEFASKFGYRQGIGIKQFNGKMFKNRKRLRLLLIAGGVCVVAAACAVGVQQLMQPKAPEFEALEPVSFTTLRDRTPAPDWNWGRFATDGRVIVVQFPSLRAQSATLNRIVAFIEMAGAPRNRVMNDLELEAFLRKSGRDPVTNVYGHNYRLTDLEQFFLQSTEQGLVLDDAELRLKDELTSLGLLSAEGTVDFPGGGDVGFVSYVRQQDDDPNTSADETLPDALGLTILTHELSHGIFYADPEYRTYCLTFWDSLDANIQDKFREFFDRGLYDTENSEIVVNEFQAYLMFTPDPRAFSAAHVGLQDADIDDLRRRFLEGMPRLPLPVPKPGTDG